MPHNRGRTTPRSHELLTWSDHASSTRRLHPIARARPNTSSSTTSFPKTRLCAVFCPNSSSTNNAHSHPLTYERTKGATLDQTSDRMKDGGRAASTTDDLCRTWRSATPAFKVLFLSTSFESGPGTRADRSLFLPRAPAMDFLFCPFEIATSSTRLEQRRCGDGPHWYSLTPVAVPPAGNTGKGDTNDRRGRVKGKRKQRPASFPLDVQLPPPPCAHVRTG